MSSPPAARRLGPRRDEARSRRLAGFSPFAAAASIVAVAIGLAASGLASGFHLVLMLVVALGVALNGWSSRRRAPKTGWPAAMDRRPDRKVVVRLPPTFAYDARATGEAPSLARSFAVAADEAEARAVLDELLTRGPRVWPEFDQAVRGWTRFHHHGTEIARVGAPVPETTLGLALALASADGYRRAEVLRHGSLADHPRLHPLLLVRAVDHVPQVRALAAELLPDLIAASDHRTFAAMLTVACRLRRRADAAPMLDLVLTALGEAADDDLFAILASADGRSARWAGQRLMETSRLGAPQLSAIATGRFDDRLQERCAEALADEALSRRDAAPLRPLLAARSARVRTVALTGLVRLGRFEGIESSLTDSSAAVRATAQWGLRRAGQDPAAEYRALLEGSPLAPKPVIRGLGECGRQEDAGLVVPFLDDPRPQARAAAVTALRLLGAEVDLSRFLVDPAPSVTRAVVAYCSERRALPPVATLRELVRADRPRHVRRSAAALLRAHGIWHRIWVGLALYEDPDTRLSLDGLSDLDEWCRYRVASVNAPIDDRLRDELQALIRARSKVLYPDTRQTLQWLVTTARPTKAG